MDNLNAEMLEALKLCRDALRSQFHRLNIRKDFSVFLAEATAGKAIAKAEAVVK